MPDTLLIYGAGTAGAVIAVAACNEKSRTKSLERGELWIVDPATARVLPFAQGGARYDRFQERDSWWEVRLLDAGGTGASSASTEADASGASAGAPGADPADPADPAASADAAPGRSAAAASTAAPPDPVLGALGDLISERHRTLPEGSYTTHLFSKGAEKIRKKVGEEAVELILAATPEEIRSEGADLIYHMMVLLEVEGLRMEEVLAELDRRHRQG